VNLLGVMSCSSEELQPHTRAHWGIGKRRRRRRSPRFKMQLQHLLQQQTIHLLLRFTAISKTT
jgi:hypothetical protein